LADFRARQPSRHVSLLFYFFLPSSSAIFFSPPSFFFFFSLKNKKHLCVSLSNYLSCLFRPFFSFSNPIFPLPASPKTELTFEILPLLNTKRAMTSAFLKKSDAAAV
jgi:hypothetical protein